MNTNFIQEKFEQGVHDLYDRLEAALPQIQKSYEADAVTTFIAQCGREYPIGENTGIVFYGRANNGWDPNLFTMDDFSNQLHRFFFKLMKYVTEHFYPENWNTHIVWNNISKVVPMSEGNPTNNLWFAQYDFMVDIIHKELDVLAPKVVIFVTGNKKDKGWNTPIFEDGNLNECFVEEKEWAEGCAASLYKKNGRLYIITDRPESKPIKVHGDCIIDMIERNM